MPLWPNDPMVAAAGIPTRRPFPEHPPEYYANRRPESEASEVLPDDCVVRFCAGPIQWGPKPGPTVWSGPLPKPGLEVDLVAYRDELEQKGCVTIPADITVALGLPEGTDNQTVLDAIAARLPVKCRMDRYSIGPQWPGRLIGWAVRLAWRAARG